MPVRFHTVFGNWPHFGHTAGKTNFFAVIYHFAYRRNNSGSSAQTAFGKIQPVQPKLQDAGLLQTQILLCYINQRTTGNRWQMELDNGVTTSLSLVMNRKLAPPVFPHRCGWQGSKNIFSSYPLHGQRCAHAGS